MTGYATYKDNSWCEFSENIIESQYFKSNFRLRFDGSGPVDRNEERNIDNVLSTVGKWS